MSSFSVNDVTFGMRRQIKRIGPLGAIILLHLMFFYALQSGLLKQAQQAIPREVFVSLIPVEPAPKPETPKPPAPAPKTVPVVKKTVKRAPPVKPVVKPTPLPTPQPVEMPPMAVAAPSIEPAAPPAPAAPALPKTVSGVEYIQAPRPEYPAVSRRMGEEGKVILRILINEKGRPERIEVRTSSGSARLDEAARKAAARALFQPHLEDGKPVAVYALVPIDFSIQ